MSNVNLSRQGPPETVIPPEPADALAALQAAEDLEGTDRRDAVAAVCGQWPTFLAAWATLGDLARDDVEGYAYYRVGYHRGLDKLRANGWRGSGYVRWEHETNQGFLRALEGLGKKAKAINEHHEAERVSQFLGQLDPGRWKPGYSFE